MVRKLNPTDRRKERVRRQLRKANAGRPRLTVHRSSKHIYAQIIDDAAGRTIAAANSMGAKGTDVASAAKVGSDLAAAAKQAGVTSVVFDRGGFLYHGRVKALADAAREGGLEF